MWQYKVSGIQNPENKPVPAEELATVYIVVAGQVLGIGEIK